MRIVRLLHILVVAVLVLAAADVYKIKFDSMLQAQKIAKLRNDIRRERDIIAALREQFTRLDEPVRLEELAKRHLHLKPIDVHQYDALDHLPPRPPQLVPPGTADPIAAVIQLLDEAGGATGSPGGTGNPPAATDRGPAATDRR
jgi:hypothetical protein